MQVVLAKNCSNKMTKIQHVTQYTSTTLLHFEHFRMIIHYVGPKGIANHSCLHYHPAIAIKVYVHSAAS